MTEQSTEVSPPQVSSLKTAVGDCGAALPPEGGPASVPQERYKAIEHWPQRAPPSVWGGLRRWEVVSALCTMLEARRIAELGVHWGQTTSYLLQHHPHLIVLGVDIWTPGDSQTDVPKGRRKTESDTGYRSYADERLDLAYRHAVGLRKRYMPRLILYPMTTLDAAKWVDDRTLDLVFVDASHVEADVVADIKAWARKVRPGGMICGHDLDMPSVRNAVIRSARTFVCYPDSMWSFPITELRR